jgi:hypothetical protein
MVTEFMPVRNLRALTLMVACRTPRNPNGLSFTTYAGPVWGWSSAEAAASGNIPANVIRTNVHAGDLIEGIGDDIFGSLMFLE